MERSMSSSMRDEEWIVQLNRDTINSGGAATTTVLAENWVSKVSNELSKLPQTRSVESKRWEKQSIYRIPWSVKELRSGAYQPQTVSIGPYHHGAPQLESTEEHKHRALLSFLERSKRPLRCYVDALAPAVEDLKDAYHQLELKWRQDTEAFLQLMIVDGCFILEIMRTAAAKAEELTQMGYAGNDPVFSNHGKLFFVPYLKRDMLMLENQLPLLVLVQLLVVEDGGILMSDGLSKHEQLSVLILKFFSQPHEIGNMGEYEKCHHILDLYRTSMLLPLPRRKTKPKERCSDCLHGRGHKDAEAYIRSATELKEAGIRFKPSKTCLLNDISFRGGALELPLIVVDDALESQYLNMMALERLHAGAGNEVTSFVFFMDGIIDSARDVALLHSRGVVQKAVGSDEAVADIFNALSRDVCLDPDGGLFVVHKQVAEYCEEPLPRWLAYAMHNYFTNPWVGLSILAAIFLFALTGIQTVYAVLAYYIN